MSAATCSGCGGPTPHQEIPAGLDEAFRAILNRTPLVCSACVEREKAEHAERDKRMKAERAERERARAERELEEAERERDERLQARRLASGIPERLRGLTLERVAPGTKRELLEEAQTWAYCAGRGLLLIGPVGVGKTYLAAAAAWAKLDRVPVRWFAVPMLFAQLGRAFDDDRRREATDALVDSSHALVLDDLDKARPTEYAAHQLCCAIDGRITEGASLLVTTNLELSALAAKFPEPFGAAIASRLAGYCQAFELEGHDRRLERRSA